MFLHLLTAEESAAFLSLAHGLILSDGLHIAADEQEIIRRMAGEMGVAPTFGDSITTAAAPLAFKSQRAKDAALLELIAVAYADEHFSIEENTFIRGLAESFGITKERIVEMDVWVREVRDITIKGAQLLTA